MQYLIAMSSANYPQMHIDIVQFTFAYFSIRKW